MIPNSGYFGLNRVKALEWETGSNACSRRIQKLGANSFWLTVPFVYKPKWHLGPLLRVNH